MTWFALTLLVFLGQKLGSRNKPIDLAGVSHFPPQNHHNCTSESLANLTGNKMNTTWAGFWQIIPWERTVHTYLFRSVLPPWALDYKNPLIWNLFLIRMRPLDRKTGAFPSCFECLFLSLWTWSVGVGRPGRQDPTGPPTGATYK